MTNADPFVRGDAGNAAPKVSPDKPPVAWPSVNRQPPAPPMPGQGPMQGQGPTPAPIPGPMQAWPVYPPPSGAHYGWGRGASVAEQAAPLPWFLITIVAVPIVAVVGAAIVIGVIAWRATSNRSVAAAPSSDSVIYSSIPPPDVYAAPADSPPPFPEESIAPAYVPGEPVSEATPSATRHAPVGTRLELAAAVNSEQTIVFLNDVAPLIGVRLPIAIRIGDEPMKVTALDDFRDAVTVERSEGVSHSVSATVEVVQSP